MKSPHRLTQHIRCGLTPLPVGTLLPSVATSYMLGTIYEIQFRKHHVRRNDGYEYKEAKTCQLMLKSVSK